MTYGTISQKYARPNRGRPVLVAGGSGFAGSAVVSQLLGAGFARSDTSAGQPVALDAGVVEGSLADLDVVQRAAAASDGVPHLAFRHRELAALAADTDHQVVEALGDALAGTGRPLVVTSGTLVFSLGRIGRETDKAVPDPPAAPRVASEKAVWRGIRVAVVRLAPIVHDAARRAFAGTIAERRCVSGHLGAGSQRRPAVHRQDAAMLYWLALEQVPEGSVLCGVGEGGIPPLALAARIGELCDVPVRAVAIEQAKAHFGWLAGLVATDAPASSAMTRRLLGGEPSHRELIDDLAYFVGKFS